MVRGPFGLAGLVGPPGGGVGGTSLGAGVDAVGLAGHAQLELGEAVPQCGHRGEGGSELLTDQGPAADVGQGVELGVDPGSARGNRVRLAFVEYRCHTGNSGTGHRQSCPRNQAISDPVEKYFREVSTSSTTGAPSAGGFETALARLLNHRIAAAQPPQPPRTPTT